MVKCPLEQVDRQSFRRFLRTKTGPGSALMNGPKESRLQNPGALNAGDEFATAAQISIRPLPKNGFKSAPLGSGGDDLTAARPARNAACLNAPRGAGQEARARARWPWDSDRQHHQLLSILSFASQTLRNTSGMAGAGKERRAPKLRELLGEIAEEVEHATATCGRVSGKSRSRRRPPGHDSDGVREADRRIPQAACAARLAARTAARHTELTLYRILQEALTCEKHRHRPAHVTVCLTTRR